ncbi:helix-turn-helix transcriptional regulator [Mariniflexile soesokkakense]|uniref:Helix-turn-helix transcriptional regulator n=1 Tax=Mariniflexile soesokkakense TaxID=1343160 RepID=A0ABV0ACY0_9FLAO
MNKDLLSKKIGNRIVELRTRKGLNQSDLARLCAKDRQAIEKIENGKVNSTIFSLYEVSVALEIDLHELLNF